MKILKIFPALCVLRAFSSMGEPCNDRDVFLGMKKIIIKSPKYGIREVLIDDEDYIRVCSIHWNLQKDRNMFYAVSNTGKIKMHRFVLGEVVSSVIIDHADRNGLNNQKQNLRRTDRRGNGQNRGKNKLGEPSTSKFKGVSWIIKEELWRVAIRIGEKPTHLGYFDDEVSAGIAYNHAAKEHFREFAHYNDIPNWENIVVKPKKRAKSSEYRGVYYKAKTGRWGAAIYTPNPRQHLHIGYFSTEKEAALAYNKKALEVLGDKAKLNTIKK